MTVIGDWCGVSMYVRNHAKLEGSSICVINVVAQRGSDVAYLATPDRFSTHAS